MSTPYAGKPANVENNLPAAVNISSTTNATPIVITTTTNHGLSVGEFFSCNGADELLLNGTRLMAGAVTATTVVALVAPTGANTVGTLAGAANGTLRSLQYGTTVPVLADGDPYVASSWNVYEAALADRVAWLEASSQNALQDQVTFAATVTLDLAHNRSQVVDTLGANITINQSNMVPGSIYTVTVQQDGGGAWTTSWSGDFVFGSLNGTAVTGTAAAGAGQMTTWTFECITEPTSGNPALFCISKATFF